MFEIKRKDGWILNPSDKLVNAIIKRVIANDGECPCTNPGLTREDRLCPCQSYRENDKCCCNLYIKEN
jgi:ferredoxin-thioredoxin reductase catalytic subunit